MFLSLSRFSIRQQIFIGYIPVLIVLAFLAYSSFQSFQKFNESFNALREITKENITFLNIEKDVIELQRNVLVYSYVGYRGVLKKIEFLQNNLESKFETLKPVATNDPEILDRYNRILDHYNSYNVGFKEAVNEKNEIAQLHADVMRPLLIQLEDKLTNIQKQLVSEEKFQIAYSISNIQKELLQANFNIETFNKAPDSVLISKTRDLIKNVKSNAIILKNSLQAKELENTVEEFLEMLSEYETQFKKIVRITRTYLHLINVVLPGKAAEMSSLSSELDEMITVRSAQLSSAIRLNFQQLQRQFIILSLFAGIVGALSSIIIAMGISKPVNKMASTLSRLSKGESDIEIPGQIRRDEVGQMAKAAHEFKIMAKNLEEQTKELEEFSYRTSHDLRSPLVSSISLLKLTRDALENDNKERALQSIELISSSLIKLENLVKDIHELTKTKNIAEEEQSIDIESIVNEAIEKLSNMKNFERLNIEKVFHYKDSFKSQKSRVVLIVENLLSNAIKYQDLNKDNSYIRLTFYEDDDNLVLKVEDNGIGIPKKHQQELFQMFKRFHPKVSFGSGLGLYMMHKSADVIGAKLVYEPFENETVFKLIIPKYVEGAK